MGLFDKLFSGGKQPEPGATPTSSPSSPSPSGENAPVARRERSKPQPAAQIAEEGQNADLLAAIAAIATGDSPDTRAAMYAILLSSDLFLISMPPGGDESFPVGEIALNEGQQLSLATIADGQGRLFLPAYTDLVRLTRGLPEGQKARYIRVNASAVCRLFLQGPGEGIVINPGQSPSGVLTRPEAQILATGAAPQINEQGQLVGMPPQQMKIVIAKTETPPAQSMLDAILAEAPLHPHVREIHLFKAGLEEQTPRLMIGIAMDPDMTPEQMHPSFEAIGKLAFEARGDTEAFDMMPLNDQLLEVIRPLESVVYLRDQQA